jgi:cyclin-dependent kinase regulatory subunit CKS1
MMDLKQRQLDISEHEDEIYYSPRYQDDVWEYRHVVLPKQIARHCPKGLFFKFIYRSIDGRS